MTDHHCPVCGLVSLRRCGRKGLWEKHVLPIFGIFPWRCTRCRARYRLSDRGAGYVRLRGGEAEIRRYKDTSYDSANSRESMPPADTL